MIWVAFLFLAIGGLGGFVIGRKTYDRKVNYQTKQLARWVDHAISDDIVRAMLPEQMRHEGQALVKNYYKLQ